MSNEGTSRPSIKVTDKRLFTDEGDLRDPSQIEPSEQPGPEVERPAPEPPEAKREQSRSSEPSAEPGAESDEPEHPGTLFTSFLDSLVVNAYMALGMVRNPYRSGQDVDVQGARQMIDIIEMLEKKTEGNLSVEESRYLKAHLGELKLAFVRRSQSI